MPSPIRTPLLAAVVLLALVASTAGCEDAVNPTLGTEQAFSAYGYLDPTTDRQALRVVPIMATLGADTARTIDAVVTSTEPATGRTATWRDSVVTYADGTVGHVFVADYTPAPDARVVLTIRAADGAEATVTVETPPLVRPEVGAALSGLTAGTYPITVRGVPRVIGGTLRLYVTGVPNAPGTSTIDVPIERVPAEQTGNTWVLTVPFLEATRARLQELGLFNAGLTLVEAEFAPFVANAEWAVPEGGFDLDAIIEPGTFSNVGGGFGFVGAGYRAPVRWVPSTNVQSLAGFFVTNDPAALIAVNEVGSGYVELYNPTEETVTLSGYRVSTEGATGGVTIGAGREIEPGGFLVVEGPFAATAGTAVQLLTGSGRLLATTFVEEDVAAWGAYPDGFSYKLPRGGPDLFAGPLQPSRGGSNEPAEVPAVINEVSTSGEGFVEVVPITLEFEDVVVGSSGEALEAGGVGLTGRRPFLVAPEGRRLVLDQLGGVVFLMVGTQVVDARFYGPQSPERSSGYLPDGPGGTWTPDLLPTEGTANAAARLGL